MRYGFWEHIDAGTPDGTTLDAFDAGTDAGIDAGSDSGDQGDEGPVDYGFCPPLPPPSGPVVTVTPDQAADLAGIVAATVSGTTIELADGDYPINGAAQQLIFLNDDVTLRSQSGDREAVVLDANYTAGLIQIRASRVTIADITVARPVRSNDEAGIYVTGGESADVVDTLVYNVRVLNPRVRSIVIQERGDTFADFGTIACSLFVLTEQARLDLDDCTRTSGILGKGARGWQVRDNQFEGFFCEPDPEGSSCYAVRFRYRSRDITVERNRIRDCLYGIEFGDDAIPAPDSRIYADEPCDPGVHDHLGGMIRNNFLLFTSYVQPYSDTGISIANACGSQVVHNTVVMAPEPDTAASIEWQYPTTEGVEITNNLVNFPWRDRNGAVASLDGNLEITDLDVVFQDPLGDLHLLDQVGNQAVDSGVVTPPGTCDQDIDGQPRDDLPDVGADELLR